MSLVDGDLDIKLCVYTLYFKFAVFERKRYAYNVNCFNFLMLITWANLRQDMPYVKLHAKILYPVMIIGHFFIFPLQAILKINQRK